MPRSWNESDDQPRPQLPGGSSSSGFTPILTDEDHRFLAGTMDAESFYRFSYDNAQESAQRASDQPARSEVPKPSWLPPLSPDGEKFLQGRMSADVYIDRTHNIAENQARAELDASTGRSLSILQPIAALASLFAVFAIAGRILDASIPTVILALSVLFTLVGIAVAVGLLLGWHERRN